MKQFWITLLCCITLLCSCNSNNKNGANSTESNADTTTVRNLPDNASIAMTGDIMMGYTFPHDRLPADSGKHIFDDVAQILQSADVTCGNLEGVLAVGGKPRKHLGAKMAFMFKMPPAFTQHLVNAGYDFLGLANNHIYDFFLEAMDETEANLKKADIGFAGAKDPTGKTKHQEYAIKEIKGVKYGFCAFGHEDYELRTQDTATVRRIITTLRKQCDVVIVCFHGGAEGTSQRHLPYTTEHMCGDNRGNLRPFTKFCIDCGADVVFGSGPHVPRCIALYKGHFIAYSLGNFCTCGMGTSAQTGLAPLITININPKDGKFKDGKIHAFRQKQMAGPKTDKSGEVIREIRDLTIADIKDNQLNIADDGTITIKK